jgi:hypothetical protein
MLRSNADEFASDMQTPIFLGECSDFDERVERLRSLTIGAAIEG